ncbi:Gldg family protein [Aeoliella sp. ICT_H6.2]|uniref:Gldg family protein n=1 Tax=Aeoliella straminimaris TaxID=2954799 RepID=A0A9X2FC05_9BACT|nr:Gldg family protein [Aeoliella straminimaris]MCO6046145.1 Gldg family protein [Aeoliella straminimaris]
MNFTVVKAIFKRDFISYFSNPTGYVFICVFVMLSSFAAFWPPAFFNNNLANLDQLSNWIPYILLVFIPAITMSMWSEERRQGTDELLLTIPATDMDVVIGKYAAGVAIFTVSLLFSMFSIWLVFSWGLGTPDGGLFLCTYLGYWFLGIAMLAVGMVASFLTKNLTVGFVLGMVFNAPLAILSFGDWLVNDPELAQFITRWGADAQLADFERGVISLPGITYFVSIAVVMLYICMVLIGKRHWGTGDDGDSRWGHYLGRTIALFILFGALNYFLSNYNSLRADVTTEKINSLSPSTVELLRDLSKNDDVDTILVDAYVSPTVPSEYAAHKLNLIGTLQELESMSGGKIQANIHEIENFSEQATTADTAFGITPQTVTTISRGVMSGEEIFMGVAVRHKLDKVVVPFIDKGIPIEYELVRSITTVAEDERKRVGVVTTDVELFGGFNMQAMTQNPETQLIGELRKQYEVVQVDPNQPISDDYDVLLAVQPSAMAPEAMNNLVAAVKRGIPIAIFEDPMPMTFSVPGTADDRIAGGGAMAMFGGGQPQPKGDINQLWDLLGVELTYSDQAILQDYNPYAEYDFPPYLVFVDEGLKAYGAPQPFNEEVAISSGFKQVLFLAPGALRHDNDSKLEYKPLTVTGTLTATVPTRVLRSMRDLSALGRVSNPSNESYVLSALIEGEMENTDDLADALKLDNEADESDEESTKGIEKNPIKAVVVADIDSLCDEIFAIRARGDQSFSQFASLDFQNVAFVLNILDYLAGDDRYLDIRKRSRPHRVLTKIDEATKKSREESREKIDTARDELAEAEQEARNKFAATIQAIENDPKLDNREKDFKIEQARDRGQRKLNRTMERLQNDLQREVLRTQRTLEKDVRKVQDRYKLYAAVLPPILPILLGILVYFHRRSGEREGVSKTRLRFNQKDQQDAA